MSNILTLTTLCQAIAIPSSIQSLLAWDQETYMPEEGIALRSKQQGFLARYVHDQWTSESYNKALSACIDLETGEFKQLNLAFEERRLVKELHRDWKKRVSIPPEFVEKHAMATAEATHVWQDARNTNNYALFEPHLKTLLTLAKQRAAYINPNQDPYDVCLDDYEPGLTYTQTQALFETLITPCKALLDRIQSNPLRLKPLNGPFCTQKQWDYSLEILKHMGFDFKRGRQDRSTHPFTIHCDPNDVRLTTRIREDSLFEALTSTVHEGGHGLYEQGLPIKYAGTPLGESASLGIHESQSRLWENHVCKSQAFWEGQHATLQGLFPDALANISPTDLYAHVNQVVPGPIRVEADELTYIFHIYIRFACEKALFNNDITTTELPEYWNHLYKTHLNIDPKTHTEGLLQDIHWSGSNFGYFPTYVIGSICAAQLYNTLSQHIPNLPTQIKTQNWQPITTWLTQNIHQQARQFSPNDLIKQVTGSDIDARFLLDYFEEKYMGIYGI